jgi:TonB family protein
MKNKVKEKINNAAGVLKNELINQIKSKHQERFDQMLIDTDELDNNIFYLRYHARFVNYKPTKVEFILDDNISYQFKGNYEGGSAVHGKVGVLDPSFIANIERSDSNISKNGISSPSSPGIPDKVEGMIYLKDGFQKWIKKTQKRDAFEESVTKKSTFSFFDSKSSGSSEYQDLKSRYFSEMRIDFLGNKPSDNQNIYFIPDLTQSKNCGSCSGKGESKCPTCGGKGKIKCKGWVGPGSSGPASNEHHSCKNGISTCSNCNGKIGGCRACDYTGRAKCPTCHGAGENTCSKKYNSSYGIGKLMDSAAGTKFCEGSGVITCAKCKGHGEFGEMVYVELIPQDIDSEYFIFENEVIPNVEKSPELVYKYLDTDGLSLHQVYCNENGDISFDYDSFTKDVCEKIEKAAGLEKNDYPKLFLESVYYDVVPAKTIDYLHVLSATRHKVSLINVANEKEILFHSNPTAVSKFSIGNLWKAYMSKWSEAFMTKSYRKKRDKYNEIKMLIHIAKADGEVEESEKLVLAKSISGLNEYTASEKSALFSLMSAKELPQLVDDDFVFSSSEVADSVKSSLKEMAWEDGELEAPEIKLMEEFSKSIDANLGRYNGKFKQFIKTWQVSFTVLIMLTVAVLGVVYFVFIKPKQDAYDLHVENLKLESHINGFISWTVEDTIQNLNFSSYMLSSSLDSDDWSSETLNYSSPEELLHKLFHSSEYLLYNNIVTYKAYWEERRSILKNRIDSLMPILERRIEYANSLKSESNSSLLDESESEEWFAISDPDGTSNLRETPNGKVLREVYNGEKFKVLSKANSWIKVRFDNGEVGYIHSSHVVEYEEEVDGYEEEVDGYEEDVDGYEEEVEEASPLPPPPAPKEEQIFSVVEQMPRFPAAECDAKPTQAEKDQCAAQEMYKYIFKNVEYPALAIENNIGGRAIIQFIVEKDGSITDIKLARELQGGLGEEAIRVVELMAKEKKWIPGMQRGKAVRVRFTLPIQFRLE